MTSNFPISLDDFPNPSSSTDLNAPGNLKHSTQHQNINNAIEAIEKRIGVTGSNVSTTIDYELHNVENGHSHDGINSRAVALGTSGSVSKFTDGLFEFTAITEVGDAVSRINEILKVLAPGPAPNLDNIGTADGGANGKLSFGDSQNIIGFVNVTGTGALPPVDINEQFVAASFNGDLRRGIFNNATIINGVLNDDVAADLPNFPEKSFGNGDVGRITLSLNNVTLVTVSLGAASGAITSSNSNGSFLAVSPIFTGSFTDGTPFTLFKHRTGVWSVDPTDQNNGWNFVRITHELNGDILNTNFITWVVDNNTASPTAPSGSLYNLSLTGIKYLTGVKYFTGGTALYDTVISGAYKNVYSSGNAVTFTNSSNITFASQPLSGITIGSEDENKTEIVTAKLGTISATKLLPGTITARINCVKPVGTNLIGGGASSIDEIFLNSQSSNSATLRDRFRDENFRLEASNYDLQADVVVSGWDSTINRSGTNNLPLVVFDENLYALPNLPNAGNGNGDFSGFVNGPSGNVDYSNFSGSITYYRKFQNNTGGSRSNFALQITGSGTWSTGSALLGNNNRFLVEIKLPEKTGWNVFSPFEQAGAPQIPNDGAGILNGSFDENLNATNRGSFGSIFVADNDHVVMKITTDAQWTGRINDVKFVWET